MPQSPKYPAKELRPDRLRLARTQAGLTTLEVASSLGIRRPAISEMEHGKRNVSADELAKLAKLYRVSESWLRADRSTRSTDNRAALAADVLAHMSDAELNRLMKAVRIVRQRRSPVLDMPTY